MTAIDVRKAFLKGVSYEELSQVTNQPARKVAFELDGDAVEVLQTLPGFSNFDPYNEVLEMLKPGTGCKDAPDVGRFSCRRPRMKSLDVFQPHMMSSSL